ncbi:MAG: cobalamin-binding protein [Frankiales bacterium]|nr:cobalamin-binding protein [Frankiales bacterium]
MSHRRAVDDLGTSVALPGRAERIVSLVPSLTEAIVTSAGEALVAATQWCTHPADLPVERVRGTKNPDVARIIAMRPDLVVCNQEENRELDVTRLRAAGVAVWVTRIETLDEAFESMTRLFTIAMGRPRPAWLAVAEAAWSVPSISPRRSVAVPIWRDPWMVVGSRTFTSDLLGRLGADNVYGSAAERYPHVTIEQILDRNPDLIVLPDEPYTFHAGDGPEAFPGRECLLVSGRDLTWYGPSLVSARAELNRLLDR